MVSEQTTRACKILSVMAIISESRVFKAAKKGTRRVIQILNILLTLDWDDELWDDWKDLGSALFEHIEHSLHREESVWILLLSDTLEEDWQVVMVVELFNSNLPLDLAVGSIEIHNHWHIIALIEHLEWCRWYNSTQVKDKD